MKTLYALSLLLLLVSFPTQAQEVIYQQDFNNTTTGLTSGFTSSTNSWATSRTAPVSNSAGASGASYLMATKKLNSLELKGISIDGFADVSVSWTGYRNTEKGFKAHPIKLYYKINTATSAGTEVEAGSLNENMYSSGWQIINNGNGIQLPSLGKNAYTLDLKWTVEVDDLYNKNAYYAMDDIMVKGTRNKTTPPTVKTISFRGQVQEGGVRLNWSKTLEKDNDKFVIERSLDGTKFSKIGEVKGSGNSLATVEYSYSDNAPVAGTNYYRLRQVDINGKESLSYVVALEVAAAKEPQAPIATVYPTVATESISISLNVTGSATISMLDATGTPVTTISNTMEHEVVLPVQGLKSGVYFVRVTDGQSQKTQRFIKQ